MKKRKKRLDPAQKLMRKWGPQLGFTQKRPTYLGPLVRAAIRDAMVKALKAQPVDIHFGELLAGYMIDGEVFGENEAMQKILGQYSWWNEQD